GFRTARADTRGKMFVDAVGHKKLRIFRPAIELLNEADFILAQRFAVRGSSVLSMWRPITNVAVQNNERWPITRLVKDVYGVLDALDIVGVAYTQNIPSISQKSCLDVLRKRDARFSLDGDVIVVVDPAKVDETQVTGQ